MPPPAPDVRNGRKATLLTTGGESGLWDAAQRFWQKSYAGDYLGLAILAVALVVMHMLGEPFHQMFSLGDLRIAHPHAEVERVSVFWLMVYAAGIPLAILLAWTLTWRPGLHKAHVTLLGLAISIVMTSFITDVIKNAVGRPRPDLIDRCQPELTTPKHTLVTIEVCTAPRGHTLHDGFRSFPSGHSSFAFAGLGWLSFFFASQAHVLRPRANLAVVLLCLAPLLAAALIAMSRLEDYRHDVADVTVGSLLGFLTAYFNWRRYYPSLLSNMCAEPHPPLVANGRVSPGGSFQRVRDVEEGIGDGMERFSLDDDEARFSREITR